ncbi:MAG: SPFH domain-containing protein [Alphaproteobacteria bacterium]|nr:SPFH domain-containing protein [Alphaproteobacteria bacterium]
MSQVKVTLPGGGSGRSLFKLAGGGVALLAGLLGAVVLYAMFTTEVKADSFAVRQVFLGPNKGIQEELFGPGLHFVMPGYERLHAFPRNLKLLEFNDNGVTASGDALNAPSIRIQTSEGYQVTVDVTIAYRILDPYKVIKSVGPGNLYETSLMIPRSDKVLRQKLGELNAEEFYQGSLRRAKAEEARSLLAADIKESGIQVWNVMVRHYTYDSRYQEAIEQRKIQDQTVFKNRAEAVAASREAEKNRVLAEGSALIEVEKERGRAEVKKIRADADLYYREKVAEGDLLVALAEAEGTRLENQALQAAGAGNMVGLKMADVLENAAVIVVPTDGQSGVNPLDLDQLIRGW